MKWEAKYVTTANKQPKKKQPANLIPKQTGIVAPIAHVNYQVFVFVFSFQELRNVLQFVSINGLKALGRIGHCYYPGVNVAEIGHVTGGQRSTKDLDLEQERERI